MPSSTVTERSHGSLDDTQLVIWKNFCEHAELDERRISILASIQEPGNSPLN